MGAPEMRRSSPTLLVRGSLARVRGDIFAYIRDTFNLDAADPLSCVLREYDRLAVGDVRDIRALASLAPARDLQVLVIGFETVTVEAQNALLKTLEEPNAGTVLMLVTPIAGELLPTVLSRAQLVALPQSASHEAGDEAQRWLAAGRVERVVLADNLAKQKDVRAIRGLLNDLELHFACSPSSVRGHADILRELALVRRYVADRSCSHKLLLSHLALALP